MEKEKMTLVLPIKKQYVIGFAFNEPIAGSPELLKQQLAKLILLHKNRPESMSGYLNAPGGAKMAHESPVGAMIRTFEKETKIATVKDQWRSFHAVEGPDYKVWCYATVISEESWSKMVGTTDEALHIATVGSGTRLGSGFYFADIDMSTAVPDLVYLIPMAMHELRQKT
jgi:hypothetical protein